jgi:uncharacterized membrane protein YdjX (TVP38/TMEM64 family)
MEAIRTWIIDHVAYLGPIGGPVVYIGFLSLYMTACLPPEPIEFLPGFLFGAVVGTVVSVAGKLLGVIISMLIGRYLFRARIRSFVFRRFPIIRRIAFAIEREGFWAVVLVRGLAIPAAVKNYGISACLDVSIALNVLASSVIVVPHAMVWAWIGRSASTISKNYHEADTKTLLADVMPEPMVLIALGVPLSLFAVFITRNVARRIKLDQPVPDEEKED